MSRRALIGGWLSAALAMAIAPVVAKTGGGLKMSRGVKSFAGQPLLPEPDLIRIPWSGSQYGTPIGSIQAMARIPGGVVMMAPDADANQTQIDRLWIDDRLVWERRGADPNDALRQRLEDA